MEDMTILLSVCRGTGTGDMARLRAPGVDAAGCDAPSGPWHSGAADLGQARPRRTPGWGMLRSRGSAPILEEGGGTDAGSDRP